MTAPHLLAQGGVDALAKRGFQGVVIVETESQTNLRFANNNLTTNGVSFTTNLTVVAITNSTEPSVGISGGAVHESDQLERLVDEAVAAAGANPPAPDHARLFDAQSSDWANEPALTSMSDFADFSPRLAEAMREARAAKRLLFGFAQQRFTTTYLATTAGARLRHEQPTATVELTGRTSNGDASAWWGGGEPHMAQLDPLQGAGELTRRLGWSTRKIALEPGRHEVLLPPSAVADLMIYLTWSAGARDAFDGRSVFSSGANQTRIGERLSAKPFTLSSDPADAGIECAPFEIAHASTDNSSVFDSGMQLQRTNWINAGTLSALFGSRYTEKETGIPAAPFIDNLVLEADGTETLDGMIAKTGSGLLLTCLWYIREVDPKTLLLTGLTRDGVYSVQNGEIVGAVSNFRFNESPVELLGRCAEVGVPQRTLPREWSDYFTRTKMPPLRIPDFNFSSISPGI